MVREEVVTAIQDAERFIQLAKEYLKEEEAYENKLDAEFDAGPWPKLPVCTLGGYIGAVKAQALILRRQLAKVRNGSN